MTTTDALKRLREQIGACTEAQIQDVITVLRRGAGIPPLPAGALPLEPLDLPPARREAYWPLAEAVCDQRPDWRPIRAGRWEDVLATHVLEGDWAQIRQTAAGLHAELHAEEEAGEATNGNV